MFTKLNTYVAPDLAIAFDSGSSQDDIPLWQETMKRLVDLGIPTVFTVNIKSLLRVPFCVDEKKKKTPSYKQAFDSDEAEAESRIMINAGATLHPELGPKRNPWASKVPRTEPNKVIGFYAVNGWLSGGFRRDSE